MKKSLVCLLVCVFFPMAALADFDRGLAAYKRGDYATAYREFRAEADQGSASAQFNVALMYQNGRGVAQNDVEAVRWYRRAQSWGAGK